MENPRHEIFAFVSVIIIDTGSMYNLLSTEDKKIVRSEYYRRLISVILGTLLSILLAGLMFLIPLLINVYSGSKNTKVELESLKSKPASNDYRDLENIIKETKTAMDILKGDMAGRSHITGIIIEVLDNKPKGISVDSISWFNDDSGVRLDVSGVASTRELLRKYVLALKSNKAFSEATIPVSSFAKAEEADFVIAVKVKK